MEEIKFGNKTLTKWYLWASTDVLNIWRRQDKTNMFNYIEITHWRNVFSNSENRIYTLYCGGELLFLNDYFCEMLDSENISGVQNYIDSLLVRVDKLIIFS